MSGQLFQNLRRNFVAQRNRSIGMFNGLFEIAFFHQGDGQIVVGNRKIRLDLEGFLTGIDALFHLTVHEVGTAQGSEGLNIPKIEMGRSFEGFDSIFQIAHLEVHETDIAVAF